MLETKNKKHNFLLLSLPVSSLYFPCLSILGGPSTKYLTTVTDSTEIISTLSNSQLQHRTEWFFVIHYISLNNERSTHLWLQVSVDKIILPQHLQPWSCTEQTTQFLPRIPTFSLKEEGGGGKKSETQWIRLIPSCLIKCLATASDTLPWRWIYVARSPPVQYSRIKYILSSVYSPNKKTLLYYQKNQNLNLKKKKKYKFAHLNCLMEPDDVGMRDLTKDRDLLQEAIFDLAVQYLLIDLFHGDHAAAPAVAAPPHDGERAGPHPLRAHDVVPHHTAPRLLRLHRNLSRSRSSILELGKELVGNFMNLGPLKPPRRQEGGFIWVGAWTGPDPENESFCDS